MKFNLLNKYLMSAGVLLAFAACEEKVESPRLTEPAVLGMQDAGGEPKKIELYDSGAVSTAAAEFRVVAKSISGYTLSITFKADPSKVDEYNKANGTDYEMAPSECYDMAGAEVMLPRYNTVSSTARVSVSTAGIPDAETYLLPITIDQITGDDQATISEDENTVYVIIKKYVLKEPVELDRSDWEVIYCNSEAAEANWDNSGVTYKYGPAKYIFDNEKATWWNYASGTNAPFYVVIDLKKEMYIKKIILTARPASHPATNPDPDLTRGAPRNVDFAFASTVNGTGEAAMNGDYSDFEVFTDLEQFRSRLNYRGEITLGGLYYCRYIKMRVNGAWHNSDTGAPDYLSPTRAYNVAMLGEFEAAGYTDSPYE